MLAARRGARNFGLDARKESNKIAQWPLLSGRGRVVGGDDAPRAYRAVRKLAASPASAVELFRSRIKPIAPADEQHVRRLIADLDSDEFAARQKAEAELEKLGELAVAACRKALAGAPSAEARRRLEEGNRSFVSLASGGPDGRWTE